MYTYIYTYERVSKVRAPKRQSQHGSFYLASHPLAKDIYSDHFLMILLVLWLKGGGGGGSGQTLCSERSELRRAERADASEASESSRMRAVVYLKLLTRQTKAPHITQTKKCT